MDEVVGALWDELGIKGIRALRRTVFCLTMPPEKVSSGGVLLPPQATDFWAGPAHLRLIRALVVSAGPDCSVQVGDIITFMRLDFTWWKRISDEMMVGWIDETQVLGVCED